MGRYSAGTRSTGAGSTTLPIGSLYAGAAVGARIAEIGVTNTTNTAVAVKLVRLTSTGTQGAGLTEAKASAIHGTAGCAAFDTHSANPTLSDDLGYRASIAGAVGAGAVWVFDEPIEIPVGTGNGVGIIVATGSGQILDWYVVWDE